MHSSRVATLSLLVCVSALWIHHGKAEIGNLPGTRRKAHVRSITRADHGRAHPSGLTYLEASGAFLVVSSDGGAFGVEANGETFVMASPWAEAQRPTDEAGGASAFINVAFDARSQKLLTLEADGLRLLEMDITARRRVHTTARYDISHVGIQHARGLAVDPASGALFVLDTLSSHIVRIDPAQGSMGAEGLATGQVSYIGLGEAGSADVRGLAFNSSNGHLYTLSPSRRRLYEISTDGQPVADFDLSSAVLGEPGGFVFAPASKGSPDAGVPAANNLYIVDSGARTNTGEPGPGRIVEVVLSAQGAGPGMDLWHGGPSPSGSAPRRPRTSGGGRRGTFTSTARTSAVITGGVQVAASSDDAEESATGTVNLTSSDLELVHDGTDQIVGIRFNNIAIPNGAAIAGAYIQFQTDEVTTAATQLTIFGQAVNTAPTFTTTSKNISSRVKTSASVDWAPSSWTSVGQVSALQKTPDLTSIVQEIVNRSGWASGNSIAFIIKGTGHRTAVAFDGIPSGAPALFVQLTGGGPGNQIPIVDAGSGQTITLPADAGLNGSASDDGLPTGQLTTTWSKVSGPGSVTFADPSATQTTSSFGAEGTYVLRLTASDSVLSATSDTTIVVQPAGGGGPSGSVSMRVSTSSDDAEESSSGSMSLTSGDLELVHDSTDQVVGLRFNAIAVPNGAVISRASIQFTADEAQSETTHLTIFGQKIGNAPVFTSSASNVSSRAKTTASVTWDPGAWGTVGETGALQRTPELRAIVQEIVNQSAWASGNSLAFVISGTGHRTAVAFDGDPTGTALLSIQYGFGIGGNLPPSVDAGSNQSILLTGTASLSGSASDDGLPLSPGRVTFSWTKVSGPGTVTFTTPTSQNATARFSVIGTYVLRLTANDGELTGSDDITIQVGDTSTSNSQIAVYVGYYDTHHPGRPKPKPNPWKGSSGVVFVGKSDPDGGWDTSAVRIDNLSGGSLSGVVVTVDMGSDHFALWGTNTIPANGILMLAQTNGSNFDGSDTNDAGCYGCNPSLCASRISSAKPVVHVTIGGRTTNYVDTGQVLNTKGVDFAGCPYTGTRNDESQNWVRLP